MEAFNRKLYTKIIEQTYRQYTIPVYQRTYTWKKQQCNQLFDDIIDSVKKQRNHYLGSLVYLEKSEKNFSFCQIIDGQQRLTTVILLLKALYDCMDDDSNARIKNRIYNSLYNDNCEERYKLKLKSIDSDNEELEKVLMGNFDELDASSNLSINYYNFKSRILSKIEDGMSYDDIFEGITNLEIVEIILNDEDDAQLIFESINSTGINLTPSDLIRNFLLMGINDAGKQTEYYKKYWVKLQNDLTKDNIEKFFYDFLIMKDSKYIEESALYENFKNYYRKINDQEVVLEEILRYSSYYKLIFCNDSKAYSAKTNTLCEIFGILKHNTIYSFLLKVCDDFKDIKKLYNKNLSLDDEEKEKLLQREEEFNNILELFGNYAIRRNVCGIPSSSLRRFYASLYDKVFKNKNNLKTYYKSLESFLCRTITEDKFPNDVVFKNGLYYTNLYKRGALLKRFFNIIENGNSKEKIDFSTLTIEHIMPQTLSNTWQKELGTNYEEVYTKYVNTLGNLSLTGYNSELSNSPFLVKKKLILEYKTKINILNEELYNKKITRWREKEIKNRAERLSKYIMDQYPYPKDIDTSLEFDLYEEVYIDCESEDETFINDSAKLCGFKLFDKRYSASNYRQVYTELLGILYDFNHTILKDLAVTQYKFDAGKRINFSLNEEDIKQNPVTIGKEIYVETNFSKNTIISLIKFLLEKYEISLQEFCLLYIVS